MCGYSFLFIFLVIAYNEFVNLDFVNDLSSDDFRKKKAVHKTTTTDDKRLQSTLKRIGVNAIPAIEEVNIFKDDVVIQFLNPKGNQFKLYILSQCYKVIDYQILMCFFSFSVQASIAANTWVVSGSPQTKSEYFHHFFYFLKLFT